MHLSEQVCLALSFTYSLLNHAVACIQTIELEAACQGVMAVAHVMIIKYKPDAVTSHELLQIVRDQSVPEMFSL